MKLKDELGGLPGDEETSRENEGRREAAANLKGPLDAPQCREEDDAGDQQQAQATAEKFTGLYFSGLACKV